MKLLDFYPKNLKEITLAGHRCALFDEGDGIPIIFLHGFSVNLAVFSSVFPLFLRDHRVIAFDYPGYYLSEKRDEALYSIPFMADAVLELIRKLKLSDVILVGSSMGGAIAIEAAYKNPKNIRALIGLAPAGFSGRNLPLSFIVYLQGKFLPHDLSEREMFDRLLNRVDTFFYDKKNPAREDIIAGYYAMKARPDFGAWVRTLMKMAGLLLSYDARRRARNIEIPALILWGDKDEVLPVKGASLAKKAMKKNLTVEIIPNGSHLFFIETPGICAEKIRGFLARLQGGAEEEAE